MITAVARGLYQARGHCYSTKVIVCSCNVCVRQSLSDASNDEVDAAQVIVLAAGLQRRRAQRALEESVGRTLARMTGWAEPSLGWAPASPVSCPPGDLQRLQLFHGVLRGAFTRRPAAAHRGTHLHSRAGSRQLLTIGATMNRVSKYTSSVRESLRALQTRSVRQARGISSPEACAMVRSRYLTTVPEAAGAPDAISRRMVSRSAALGSP